MRVWVKAYASERRLIIAGYIFQAIYKTTHENLFYPWGLGVTFHNFFNISIQVKHSNNLNCITMCLVSHYQISQWKGIAERFLSMYVYHRVQGCTACIVRQLDMLDRNDEKTANRLDCSTASMLPSFDYTLYGINHIDTWCTIHGGTLGKNTLIWEMVKAAKLR